MGAVVVRFGEEVCVVLQTFAANKMIIRKLREKDDYRSDYLMTNLVNAGRHDFWITVCGNLWLWKLKNKAKMPAFSELERRNIDGGIQESQNIPMI